MQHEGGQTRGLIMGFFTEMFSRPRPQEPVRTGVVLVLQYAMSHGERREITVKPADFPRIARAQALR
jgi:hypothetical protein